MMRAKRTVIAFAAVLFVTCASAPSSTAPMSRVAPPTDILGIRLGMPRDAARSALAGVATLEREERRRQEVWTVTNDPRFASLIIGYTKEWNVRFVTAIAKPDGVPVRVEDVIDTTTADHRVAGQTHTWTWTTGTPPYYVIGIGGPERLEYLSIKDDPTS
jgi:hypothetical protein